MIKFERITANNRLALDQVNALYDSAFPLHEQRQYSGRETLLSVDDYCLYQLMDDDQFIGLIGTWNVGDYYYIEHLAISVGLRGLGYGQKVIEAFCEKFQQVVLEIDPIVDDISQKRLKFYETCGFVMNDYKHLHPSYRKEFPPHELLILSYPHKISAQDYQMFADK